ncbi:MAG: 1-acyl-sn-glycerol-3-phosphate acyltransferase [Oscillospiraceae bacterium]|nr:1-acyl-sn-glycerol-3-phosphate acyltransferase [Oscillospiraceae bacterium]
MLLYATLIAAAAVSGLACWGFGGFQDLAWLWRLPAGFIVSLIALVAVLFVFLYICSSLVNTERPQEKDSRFYRWLITIYAGFVRVLLRMRIHKKGLEKLPRDGRFLLVCNHIHDLDPVVLLDVLSRSQLAFISKRENGQKFIVGKVMHKILCQPINRENDREALKTILKCIDLLKKDMVSIGVFPEGYTSMDGLLHPFRSGVFKIAQKAKVPIVVFTVQGTNKVFGNAKRLKSTDVQLHLLEVIPAEELTGCTTVEIAERVHALMAEDLGPENVLQA